MNTRTPSSKLRSFRHAGFLLVGFLCGIFALRLLATTQTNPSIELTVSISGSGTSDGDDGPYVEIPADQQSATVDFSAYATGTQGGQTVDLSSATWTWTPSSMTVSGDTGSSSSASLDVTDSDVGTTITVKATCTAQGKSGSDSITFKVKKECPSCQDSSCPAGGDGGETNSVDYRWNVGAGRVGTNSIWIKEENITADSYALKSLKWLASRDSVVVTVPGIGTGAKPVLRQLLTRKALADVLALADGRSGYRLRFFLPASVGARDAATGVYAAVGQPYLEFEVFNPDAAAGGRIKIAKTDRTLGPEKKTSSIFSQVAGAAGAETWIMEKYAEPNPAPIYRETLARQSLAGGTYPRHTQTRTTEQAASGIQNDGSVVAAGPLKVVARVRETYGLVRKDRAKLLLEKVIGYGTPEARTTTTAYYEEQGKPESYGRLKSILRPDGGWETWEYLQGAGADLVELHRTGWLNAPFGDKTQCREVRDVSAALGNIVKTSEERVLGTFVSRSWQEVVKNGDGTITRLYHRLTPQGDSVESFTYYASNLNTPEGGRMKFAQRANGIVERHTYSADATAGNLGGLVHTIEKGAGNANAVTDGTRTVALTSAQGRDLGETVSDIASGAVLSSRTAAVTDAFGRVLKWVYNGDNNDYSEITYDPTACCGAIAGDRGRDGTLTVQTRDSQNQVILTERTIGNRVEKSASRQDGLVSTSLQFIGGAWRTISVTERNLAGDTIRTRVIAGNATNWELADTLYTASYPQGGGMVRTATAPDATVTVGESFADGQARREVSAAQLETIHSYGIHSLGGGGLWQIDQNGARWSKSYSDIAGRVFRQERPSFGGGTVAKESTYNLFGQLVKVTQPGLAPMLYDYNVLGERIRSTLDVNNNGAVDFAGTDRITENEAHVVASATVGGLTIAPARVSVSRVYAGDGQAVVTSVSYADTVGWLSAGESFGVVSKRVQTMPVNGAWTEASTRPDAVRTESVYADGRLAEQKTVGTDSSILSHVIYAYDDQGRPFRVTERRHAPGGDNDHVTTTAYYNSGAARSVTTPANETSSWVRDIMGRGTVATLPDASTRTTEYDAFGRVRKTYGSQTYPVEYGYNAYGEMETMKTWQDFAGNQGAAVTAWGREPATGLLLAKTDAANKAVTYTYEAAGHLLTRTWARGVTTTYGYDPATGELVSTVYSDGTPEVGIKYDRLGRHVAVSADRTAQSAFTYRADNLMPDTETVRQDADGDGTMDFGRIFTRSYDTLLRPTGFTLKTAPDAAVADAGVTYGYEPVGGRFGSVSALTAQGNVAFSYAYEPGRAALLASVSGPAHTVRNVWEPERDVLKTKTNLLGDGSTNTVVSAFDYQVNNLGQRTSVATSGSAFVVATGWQWGYDALGQVKSAAHATNSAFHRSYLYDDIGNRKQSSPELQFAPASTTNYAPNLLNQYSSITPPGAAAFNPGYDEDGNQLSAFRTPSSAFTYEWDAENRLKLVKDAQGNVLVRYAYDAQSRLIRKTQPGPGTAASAATGYVYDGWNCVAQYNLLTQPALLMRRQTWGLDLSGSVQGAGGVGGLLAVESLDAANLGTWIPTFDGNGNVSEYLGPNGGIAAHFEYDAFGNVISSSGNATAFDCRFSTKPQDAVTGLYYYGYRWYDAVSGRWLGRDPSGGMVAPNLYGYLENTPTNGIELLGLLNILDYLGKDGYTKAIADANKNGITFEKFDETVEKYAGILTAQGLYDIVAMMVPYTQEIQRKLLKNYLEIGGPGEDTIVPNNDDIKAIDLRFSMTSNKEFMKKASKVTDNKPVNLTGEYEVPGGAQLSGTLGNFIAKTKITGICENISTGAYWKVSGTFSVDDPWNFPVKKEEAKKAYEDLLANNGNLSNNVFEGRTNGGEVKTYIMMKMSAKIHHKDFSVKITGQKFSQKSTDQWATLGQ